MIARIATVPWRLLVVVVLAATGSVYAWLGLSNPHVGLLADDALYLLMAELYSPYRDAVGAVSEHVRRYSHLRPASSRSPDGRRRRCRTRRTPRFAPRATGWMRRAAAIRSRKSQGWRRTNVRATR